MRTIQAIQTLCALVLISVCVPGSTFAQDPVSLTWKFRKGDLLRVQWDMVVTLVMSSEEESPPDTKLNMTIAGRLEVLHVDKSGNAKLSLHLTKYRLKGAAAGNEVDLLFEDGVLIQDGVAKKGVGAEVLDKFEQPIDFTASSAGLFEVQGGHICSQAFAGRGVMFGPILPDHPLKKGDTWKGLMQSGQARVQGGPEFKVKYLYEGAVDSDGTTLARVLLDDDKSITHKGLDGRFRVKADVLFDPEAGRCVRHVSITEMKGKVTIQGMEFDMVTYANIKFKSEPIEHK